MLSSVWDELIGQDEAVAIMQNAAQANIDSSALAHSWLITGPPGSGRSNLAFAFAAALLSSGDESSFQRTIAQVQARTHPDLSVLSTEKVTIGIDEVRALVASSQFSPSVSRYRVVIIEDADRMTERTSNVLLKALEEPPPQTIWILCAPSEADLIPTIRSRVRSVRLRIPSVADVAKLLTDRDGIEPGLAERSARHAQSHIGMAHRLATNQEARERRNQTLEIALSLRTVADAVNGAASLIELATEDARAVNDEREEKERSDTLHALGIQEGGSIPTALRSQIRQIEEDQKRRATRSLRDGIDRVLVDFLSVYRDILTLQLGAKVDLVNRELEELLVEASRTSTPVETIFTLEAIRTARLRIEGNVAPALAIEAMLLSSIEGKMN
ncbi:MAG: DNA polymerase III subunit delta' [Cryobacterium sp.]|nr:DNA polymerase III subunit delta' [Cryobacterium sp.]MBX3104500.1 DNA polymerase III subunit delta' [Cryobacterium sp.]